MVPDESAIKPEDWDESMDGTWEPPMINNPKCQTASGCGPWAPPLADNPAFKGTIYLLLILSLLLMLVSPIEIDMLYFYLPPSFVTTSPFSHFIYF